MIFPIIPEDKLVIIAVRDGCAIVARYRQIEPYTYYVEQAINWEDLEEQAISAVGAQIGAFIEDSDYFCPPELADKAVW